MNGAKKQLEPLYDKICRELTIFETNEDAEMTDGDWLDIFYKLLVQTVNYIETLEEE